MALATLSTRNETFIDWTTPSNARFDFSGRFTSAFLGNEWRSDVSFYIPLDDRTIPAHSLIVGAASPVLERCCFAPDGILNADSPITLPDYCSAETFEIVLRYIYSGATAAELNGTNAAAVLKIADYFDLHVLMNLCGELIEPQLSTDNVCQVFDQVHHVEIKLNAACLKYMQQNIKVLLDNGNVMRMSEEALRLLLSMDDLGIENEFELVAPMITWAYAKCQERAIASTPANWRLVLGKRVHLIRFAAMDLLTFMDTVHAFGNGFFTDAEVALIMKGIHSKVRSLPVPSISPFSAAPRTPIDKLETLEFETILVHPGNSALVEADNLEFNISKFKKPFILTGLRFVSNLANKMHIVNAITGREITGNIKATDPKTIRFDQAVFPATDGQFKLRLTRNDSMRLDGYLKRSEYSNNILERSCVDALLCKATPAVAN